MSIRSKEKLLRKDGYTDEEIQVIKKCIKKTYDFSILYNDHTKKLPYRQRVEQFKMPIHNGQRKLFLSSLLFLVKYSKLSDLVVYAGASPGTNIIILAKLYPKMKFHLYDPRPFDDRLKSMKNVELFQSYFTNEIAKSYKNKQILLWSDIRTGTVEDDDFEDQIVENNMMQKKWHDLSRPVMGMYKFRLPYAVDETAGMDYMDGDIWLQLWAPTTSTETRLIVPTNYDEVFYINQEYEHRLYYFNTIDRQWKSYPSSDTKLMDVQCCCFDCTGEKYILSLYLSTIKKNTPDNIKTLSDCISSYLNTIKHLHHGYIDKPIWKKYETTIQIFKRAVLKEKERKIKMRKMHYDKNATKLIKDNI